MAERGRPLETRRRRSHESAGEHVTIDSNPNLICGTPVSVIQTQVATAVTTAGSLNNANV
jgi:hypothetical protein